MYNCTNIYYSYKNKHENSEKQEKKDKMRQMTDQLWINNRENEKSE